MKTVIVCTSDEVYLPILEVFLSSLQKNSNINYTVVARLIDCKYTPSFLSDAEVIHDNKNLSTKRDKLISDGFLLNDNITDRVTRSDNIYKGARWLYSDLMAYCANIKFNTINNILEINSVDNIMYFDADTIVRGDINELIDNIDLCDILIRSTKGNALKRVTEPNGILYHTGMIGINNNDKTVQFFRQLEARVNAADFFNWDTDQIEFSNTVDISPDIHIDNIDTEFKDESFSSESRIWCGASTGKISSSIYINEMKKYIDNDG